MNLNHCNHFNEVQILEHIGPGHIQCTAYKCQQCGRVRPNPYFRRRRRVHPLVIIFTFALAAILLGWFLIAIH